MREGDVAIDAESGRRGERREDARVALMLEEGAPGQGMQVLLEAKKARNPSPQEPPGVCPCRQLDLGLQDAFWTSGLQTCERIHVCCFEPRSLP